MPALKLSPPEEMQTGGFGWVDSKWFGSDSIVPNSDQYVVAEQVMTQIKAVLHEQQTNVRVAIRGCVMPLDRNDLTEIIHDRMLNQDGIIADMVAMLDGSQAAENRVRIAFDAAIVDLAHETAKRLTDE